MPREIVITSVPRGVKLGRTGFQVAMQTAGMRDDVAAILEKMAGYRHVASGASPVCYFHRQARTVIGPIHVVGRIVDAGVDFSNRSNKLAHMVVLEATDLGQVVGSSPATMLAAIEGRLATSWTGGPEERQTPFSLAGIPQTIPAPCATWQQVMGDAGWAGVLAERAIHNQPTLIIGRDPSPASCRQLLMLFQEALAVVPQAKRWAITFDTTTLAADGILWRGTYSGSPESQMSQPGLLVIDLGRSQAIPVNMATGELVRIARNGPPQNQPVPGRPSTPVAVPVPKERGEFSTDDGMLGVPQRIPNAVGGPTRMPPPPGADEWVEIPLGRQPAKRGGNGWIIAGIGVAVLMLIAGGGAAVLVGYPAFQRERVNTAMLLIQEFAESNDLTKTPKENDVRVALGQKGGKENASIDENTLTFLNQVLGSKAIGKDRVKDKTDLATFLAAVVTVRTKPAAQGEGQRAELLAEKSQDVQKQMSDWFPDPIDSYEKLQRAHRLSAELLTLSTVSDAARGKIEPPSEELTNFLISQAGVSVTQKNIEQLRDTFVASLTSEDLKSKAKTLQVIRDRFKPDNEPHSTVPSGVSQSHSGDKQQKKTVTPEEAFMYLRKQIKEFRDAKKTIALSSRGKPAVLFGVDEAIADALQDIEITVGTREGLNSSIKRKENHKRWTIDCGGNSVASIAITEKTVEVTLEDDSSECDLNYMPIGFKRPGTQLTSEDWITLSQPTPEQLTSAKTLYDLLYHEATEVPIPRKTGEWPTHVVVEWRAERLIPVKDSQVAFEMISKGGGKLYLKVRPLQAGAADDSVLVEPLRIDLSAGGAASRLADNWNVSPLRAGTVLERGIKPEYEAKRLGIGGDKRISRPERDLPELVSRMISTATDTKVSFNQGKGFLEKWLPRKKEKDKEPDWDAVKSLPLLRDKLVEYVSSERRGFGMERWKNFREKENAPPDPGPEPEPLKASPTAAEKDQHAKERDAWKSKESVYAAWSKRGEQQVRQDVRDFDLIDAYLQREKRVLDEDNAAVYLLRDLDGVMVAKYFRDDLEKLTALIPVAALFEGTAFYEWTLDGRKCKVPVMQIIPAEIISPLDPVPVKQAE